MQLYDGTNNRGLVQEVWRLCDADATSYPRLTVTARLNDSLEEVESWLFLADGTWNFDDENYTTLPILTYTLTQGQTSYSIADKLLEIDEVAVLTAGGVWRKLTPFDPYQLGDLSVEEYFGITASSTPTGLPTHYDKQANNVKLYPAPTSTAVTLTNGMRIRAKRTASLFTPSSGSSNDTTVPGFVSPFHVILAWMAARPYCALYKKDRVAWLDKMIGDLTPQPSGMKKNLLAFYSHREQDVRHVMTMKKINYI